MLTSISLLLALVACEGDDGTLNLDDTSTESDADTDADSDSDTDADADTDSDADTDCSLPINYLDPGNGTVSVNINVAPTVWFDDATAADASEVSATLSDSAGEIAGAIQLLNGGAGAEFVPDSPLDRDTQYTFVVETCDDSESSKFTTVTGPIEDSLVGNVYVVDLTEVTWTSPDATIGNYLVDSLDAKFMLAKVEAQSETEVDMVGASAWDDSGSVEQFPCIAPIDFEPADFTGNPAFTVGPEDTTLGSGSFEVDVYEFEFSGSFADGGDNVQNLRIRGYADIGEEYCGYLEIFGSSCEACPDGSETCVLLDITDSEAPLIDATLDENLDPADYPECN
ncbi:MAG: Ig-like domain-containing protein [Myxococcota bacterium]|nr:Ig-like domain-containing protein [Myxococcota bacterium]